MTFLCDLHLHSTASDGQYRPAEVVRLARENGLNLMALTDHDTVDGLAEATEAGAKYGVQVLSGVEMSARDFHTFHLLGYGFDPAAMAETELIHRLRRGRKDRSIRIMNYLRSKGVDFPLEEVLELVGVGIIGRPHFARVMLKRGICQTWEEVFDTYLDTDEFHTVVEDKPTAAECIDAIHQTGGFVSLAHPYQIGLSGAELEALVSRMAAEGRLDAIECWHTRHTQERSTFYLHLAHKYGLLVTGGSDFHGEQIKADFPMAKLTLDFAENSPVARFLAGNR